MANNTPEPLILLVEDEVAVRNFYQLYLEHHGYRVCPAGSLGEALRLVQQQPVSLAVVDVFLGPDNGIDLIQRMRRTHPDLPVIVMSGMGYDEPMFQEALKTGADGVYSKSLPLSQLLMDIKRVLTRATHPESPIDPAEGLNRAAER